MNGDHMPVGGHRRKADPIQAQKIREGGKRAQKIAKETTEKHQKEEVPKAEEILLQELNNLKNN